MSRKCIAIIPARGGSKRIPRKNIKNFLGKPIIAYSIEAAVSAGCFDEIMVSTDDREIAAIAKQLGARVPFFRSENASDDYAYLIDVLLEVLLQYDEQYEYICCILATAPFVNAERLLEGLKKIQDDGVDSVLPVAQFSYPIQRAVKIENGSVRMFYPRYESYRSQDLEKAYHDVGQFYWLKRNAIVQQRKIFAKHTVPVVIPELEVQDIDTEEDWRIAEIKYTNRKYSQRHV